MADSRCGSVNRPAASVPLLQLDDLGAEAGTGFSDIDASGLGRVPGVGSLDNDDLPDGLSLRAAHEVHSWSKTANVVRPALQGCGSAARCVVDVSLHS